MIPERRLLGVVLADPTVAAVLERAPAGRPGALTAATLFSLSAGADARAAVS